MKRLIINADDLGICEGANVAIGRAHREGVLTSASLMANGAAFEHAIEEVIATNPQLGIGLHLCLTSGRSICQPQEIPLLVDQQGRFRHGFASLVKLISFHRQQAVEQIRRELAAQFDRITEAHLTIDHVNGHRHFQMIPAIFRIVAKLAEQHSGICIRVSDEPLPKLSQWFSSATCSTLAKNLPKRMILSSFAGRNQSTGRSLPRVNDTYGIMGSGCMYGPVLWNIIPNLRPGVSEILTHPGTENPQAPAELDAGDIDFLHSPDRVQELDALLDGKLRDLIEQESIQLVRFSDLAECGQDGEEPSTASAAPPLPSSSNEVSI